jgi:Flp pilus assembly protein TadG
MSVLRIRDLDRREYRNERGAVAILVALSMAVLLGFFGLAFDLGKLYIAKSELQNAADACVLAAARELTGANTNQLILAEAAGIATAMRHDVVFQSETVSMAADESVTFSQTLGSVYQPKAAINGADALTMQYVRCTTMRSGIANWFIQVLNLLPGISIGDQAVSASAIATLAPSQITSCAIPVALCSSAVTPAPPIGSWAQSVIGPGKSGSGTGNLTGNFMWVDYSPPGGGASELSENLTGPGVCDLPAVGSKVGEAGVISSLAAAWNSRFGIFHGVKQDEAAPDYSGFAYTDAAGSWPSKSNAMADFRSRRGAYAGYQGDSTTGLKTSGTVVNSGYLQANGADRRLATVAVVNCDAFSGGSTVAPVESWACVLMLHPINNSQGGSGTGSTRMYLEYLGQSNVPGNPCATSGVPAGPDAGGPLVPVLVR